MHSKQVQESVKHYARVAPVKSAIAQHLVCTIDLPLLLQAAPLLCALVCKAWKAGVPPPLLTAATTPLETGWANLQASA